MNLENIISIAAESGFNVDEKSRKYQKLFIFFGIHSCQEELLTFAELVAAAEREACAKVCEDASTPHSDEMHSDAQWAALMLAAAIRARGKS